MKDAKDQKVQTTEEKAKEMLTKLESEKIQITAQLNATIGAINGIKQLLEG